MNVVLSRTCGEDLFQRNLPRHALLLSDGIEIPLPITDEDLFFLASASVEEYLNSPLPDGLVPPKLLLKEVVPWTRKHSMALGVLKAIKLKHEKEVLDKLNAVGGDSVHERMSTSLMHF